MGGDSPLMRNHDTPSVPMSNLQPNPLNQFSLGSGNGSVDSPGNTLGDVLASVVAFNAGQSPNGDWMSDSVGPKRPLSFTITASGSDAVNFNSSSNRKDHTGEQGSGPVQHGQGLHAQDQQTQGQPNQAGRSGSRLREPAEIYANVREPFSYTPAYHGLIAYLRSRFQRDQLLKMARCMAAYRPSFIACTNGLKEDDLIFMEQCFQRTLLEYEKIISLSGTPTVVWRRTGQIAAAGKEFCILSGWPRERLLGQRTFVVELMDDNSVLEYFEMFSKIAFGDSRGATMAECTLLSPSGQNIKTSCMWTLKRDVFGIPMMIIGNVSRLNSW